MPIREKLLEILTVPVISTTAAETHDILNQVSFTFHLHHCVKKFQIKRFFWSIFSRIRTEYGGIRSISCQYSYMQQQGRENITHIKNLDIYPEEIYIFFKKKEERKFIFYVYPKQKSLRFYSFYLIQNNINRTLLTIISLISYN